MNAVGIDISKGKSTVTVMRPFGEVVARPFLVSHSVDELTNLVVFLNNLEGAVRVVMEYTGIYYLPVARFLYDAGFFVCVVHPKLIHDFGNNSIRKVKTDKADAVKIASYCLAHWDSLVKYAPVDDSRLLLKTYNRQYNQYMKLKVALKNNLITLLDQTFPGVNTLFTSPSREDGHQKWVDFAERFWHCGRVSRLSKNQFTTQYNNWCIQHGYNKSNAKAAKVYDAASQLVSTLPQNAATKQLIGQAISQINTISVALSSIRQKMEQQANLLPEYPVVRAMYGVGDILALQLMAEIGDVRRFPRKQSLTAFAGLDAPPFQSGSFSAKSHSISKRGSSALRKTLFQVMRSLLQNAPAADATYKYMMKKRLDGKCFYVYMVAGCNKFLRIYYARVKEFLTAEAP